MNPLVSEYLSPTNPVASWIVTFLICLFCIWIAGLIANGIRLFKKKSQIRNLGDIESVVDTPHAGDAQLDETVRKENADTKFRDFCRSKSLPAHTEIAKHLKAIFQVGRAESRLDVSELINHTTSNLFRWNGPLRSILAIFIVIGLLGTLFGLADSLTKLAPELVGVSEVAPAENNKEMVSALSLLLNEIKGALAPSIWGIGFTVMGVILYGLYLALICQPVKSILERLTLTIWVPQLYPTTSQRLIQTLQQSEQQMRSGYRTASQVGELVETVQNNISDFNQNLSRANEITQPLSDSVSQINRAASVLDEAIAHKMNEFSEQFSENVNNLTGFQSEIRRLYEKLTAESEIFQRGANKALDDQNQTLEAQNRHLIALFETLKVYQDTNLASQKQISDKLEEFLNEATEANTSINANNRKMLEGVRDRLTGDLKDFSDRLAATLDGLKGALDKQLDGLNNQLTTNLTNLGDGLNQKLKELTDRFNRFDVPLVKAAGQIERIVENFAKLTQRTVGELQTQFQKQNENNKVQLDAIVNLNNEIKSLLSGLAENSDNQRSEISALSSNVGDLTDDMNKLSASIESFTSNSSTFNKSIVEIEKHVKTLGDAAGQLIEKADVTSLTANIQGLRDSIGEIARNSATLANSAQRLEWQVRLTPGDGVNRTKLQEILKFISKPFRRKSSSATVGTKSNEQTEGDENSTHLDA